MKLLTKLIKNKMILNHNRRNDSNRPSPVPVVKIFNPCGGGDLATYRTRRGKQ